MTSVARTLLACTLLAGVYLTVLLVASVDLAIVVLPVLADVLWHKNLTPLSAVFGSVAATGLLSLWYGLQVLRRVGEPWESVRLSDTGTGPLRAMIAEIAAKTGTEPPSDLRLTAIPNAGVTERPPLAGLRGRSRTLYLGLPLLAGLTVTELRAVLSHEMGHYAGGHARPGRLAHRALVMLAGLRAAMRLLRTAQPRRGPRLLRPLAAAIRLCLGGYAVIGYGFFTGYETVCRRLSLAVRRRQEFEADAIAARVVGRPELARALRRIHVLGAAWNDFRGRFLVPMHRAGCAPDDPFEEFGRMLAGDAYQDVLAGFERAQGERRTSADDTHPCLPDRLARLGADTVTADQAVRPDDRRNATELLPALLDGPWSAQLAATLRLPGGRPEALLWDECLNRLGQARAAAQAGRLARQAVGTDRAAPASVLRSVAAGRGALTAALAGGPDPRRSAAAPGGDALGLLTGLVYALIAFTMVAGGQARWRAAWGGGPGAAELELVGWDGSSFVTEQVAARVGSFVVDPTEANESWLLDHLRSLGIDPGEPVDLAGGRLAPAAAPDTAGVAGTAGSTLVIRPLSEPREARTDRLLTAVLGGVIAVIAIAVGTGASVSARSPSYQVPPASLAWAPASVPSYPGYGRLSEPAALLPRALPSDLLVPDPLPQIPVSGVSDCPPPLQADKCITIQVARGETLSQLACRYGTTVAALQQINDLGRSTRIYAGEQLTVPFLQLGSAGC